VAWADKTDYHVWMASITAAQLAQCTQPPYADVTVPGGSSTQGDGSVAGTEDGIPTTTVASTPSQVDRDEVHTTVFPWIAAGGAAGRVAVAFYGTDQDGDPNTSDFLAAWNVYVNQSLNALDGASAQFSQVKATTHPFHYDSICLNGLGCDTTQPGDRSLADFFAITYNQKDGKLSVVWDRGNKKPNDAGGYVATPMVATQIAGPSNGGGTVSSIRTVVATSATDPTGDALSSYSATAVGTEPPSPPTKNEAAADFTGVAISPDGATNGYTVTMHVSDLSTTALTQALTDSGASSLQYVWRFGNGWQDAGASAAWSPATGWTFGFDQYTTGSATCGSDAGKCVIWPQATSIHGSVDASAGTIALGVPRSVLFALGPNDADGRPTQVAATDGSRFYDGSAWSFANPDPAPSSAQTWMTQLDNTPAFDFVLPASGTSTTTSGGGGSGGGGSGGSAPPTTTTTTTPAPVPRTPPSSSGAVQGASHAVTHLVVANGVVRASAKKTKATVRLNRTSIVYTMKNGKLRFRSTRVTSVAIRGHSATLRCVGVRNGKRGVRFRVVLVAGKPATLHVWFGTYVSSGRLVSGGATVR
jgi:hypothetical protein